MTSPNATSVRDALLGQLCIGPIWTLRESDFSGDLPSDEAPRNADLIAKASSTNADSVREVAAQITPRSDLASSQLDEMKPISTMNWSELHSAVAICRACDLCERRANTVFGTGDKKAKYLFIGEGPGYDEDLQGEPFVGVAGHLLDNMMRALGMHRGEATYVTNVVKCRPTDEQGKDRTPSADEIAACLPYLQRQIALIEPKLIIALGKTAAVALLNVDIETPVAQLRGKLHRYQDIPLVVTYHPAYLLRKPAEKSKTWADLCLGISALRPVRSAD